MLTRSTIEKVKDLSIKEVLEGAGLKLKRQGSNYAACCPFHQERTPSFIVNPNRNTWKCFGCGKSGSGIDYVMEDNNLSFADAVKAIAQQHGIPIEYENREQSDEERKAAQRLESMRIAVAKIQEFFVNQYSTSDATEARNYATKRWGEEYCQTIGIGFAPKDSRLFLDYIKANHLDVKLLTELGYINTNENGNQYPMFRERLTIPISDRYGRTIAFTTRRLGEGNSPKYINSKTSELYHKDEILFGIDVAARAAREAKHFIIVEGAPDVMRLQSIGLNQAVAPLGTALTEKHLDYLLKICPSICFIPDSDPPKGKLYGVGVETVMKNGRTALEMGFEVSVKEIPRTEDDDANEVKYDPDSYITSKDIHARIECIPFILWYAKKRMKGATNPTLQSELMSDVAQLLTLVKSKNLREMLIENLSKIIGNKTLWRNAIKEAGQVLVQAQLENNAKNEDLPANIAYSLRQHGFIVRNGCYYSGNEYGEDMVRVSNFVVSPVLHIKNKSRSSRIYRLKNVHGKEDVIELYSSDMVAPRDFNKKLYDRGNFAWRGEGEHFSAFLDHLLEVTPTALQIEILGWNPQDEFYAFSNGVYSKGKFYNIDKLGVVGCGSQHYYLPAFSDIHADNELGYSFERLFRCNPNGATSLHDFVGQIVKVYGKGGMVSFAWTLAAIFRDIIFSRLKYFPVLNLFGRKGSGKTELARALSSLFYTLPSTPSSCSNTSIPVIGYNLSHVRNSVLILDEYTNDLMPQRIDILKGLWGGTSRSKMEDGIPITIPVTSGVILAGQYKPEDEAIFSRCIHLMYAQTTFSREEKQRFNELREMVLHGNTHLLLPLLDLRDVFERSFFSAFDMTLNDVLVKLDKDKVEDRILNNWVVALAAFRVLEPHISVPFTYSELFDVVVDGIRYQNDQIKKSSDTANFWLYLDSMHTQGKAKEKCHFVIKLLSSFKALKKDECRFVEPKRIIFINFKAVRALLELRLARQRTGSTLDIATLESYLKSLPQFMGFKQQRFQNLRSNGELDEEYRTEDGKSKKIINTTPSNALCFDYDSLKASLDLNLETFRISEDELNADVDDEPSPSSEATITESPKAPSMPELPF